MKRSPNQHATAKNKQFLTKIHIIIYFTNKIVTFTYNSFINPTHQTKQKHQKRKSCSRSHIRNGFATLFLISRKQEDLQQKTAFFPPAYLFLLKRYHCFSSHSCMERAARRPSPMARMTVAPPRTMSPPANIMGMSVCMVS